MLKFESIIRNLTLDEKISFITSDVKYQSFKVENYDLPKFEIKKAYDLEGINNELKISYKSLISSWGINYANRYFNDIYEGINSYEKIFGIDVKDVDKKYVDGIYPNDYLLGSFAKLEIEAVNNKGYFSCVTDFPRVYYDKFNYNDLTPYLIALSGNPSSVILKTKDALDFTNKYSSYKGFKFFDANSDEDVIYALNNGAIFIFYDNAKEAILNALDRYEVEYAKLANGLIANNEFEQMIEQGLIISNEKLDSILNEFFLMLLKLDDSFKRNLNKKKVEINEVDLTSSIAESVILLKNKGALPIEGAPRIGLIGDFADNFKTTSESLNYLEPIKKYDVNVIGYSHGFIEEDIDLDKVYEDAERIASESDYVLLFLGKYNKNQFELPKKELDLVDAIRKHNTKIIAIVNTDDATDFYKLDSCDAIIQTNILNKYGLSAILDIIFGVSTPSGRTTRYYKMISDGTIPFDKNYEYALGDGISYGIFDYSNIEVTKKGVTFTVKNNGPIGSFETSQLYISTIDSEEINFRLCGFKKMFIKSGEAIKFIIPFDEFSFKVFDIEKKKYMIKKGKYQISICSNSEIIMLNEMVELDDYIYDEYTAKNEIEPQINIKKAYQELTKDEEKNAYIKNDKAYGKKKKIFISIIVGLYYNALFGGLLVANMLGENYLVVTITVIALLAIFDIVLLIYIIKTLKKKVKVDKYDIKKDITDVIDDMDNFNLVSEVTYEKPKPEIIAEKEEEIVEESLEEESVVEEAIEEERELTYDKSITEYVDDNTYSKEIDFSTFSDDFMQYALNKGLIVEPRTVRSILGAIASSKMIMLKSQSIDLTIKFAEILTNYLNDEFVPIDLSSIDEKNKMFWQIGSQDVVYRSKLANDILQAESNPRKIFVETFYNMDITNKELVRDFYKYAKDPNNSVEIKLDIDEEAVLINKNIIFLMIPSDELFLENIDKEIADSTIYLELFVRNNEIIESEAKINYTLSYTMLENKIKENRETMFIDEDNWKKLDDVEEDLTSVSPDFSIDNKMTLAFEKMAAVMLEAGSDIEEVVDYAIASRIIPQIKVMAAYKNALDESNFKNIIVNHLGDDTVPVTERALKKPL